jgi:hypothetical protein
MDGMAGVAMVMMSGKDVVDQFQTGSGKTAAFAIAYDHIVQFKPLTNTVSCRASANPAGKCCG